MLHQSSYSQIRSLEHISIWCTRANLWAPAFYLISVIFCAYKRNKSFPRGLFLFALLTIFLCGCRQSEESETNVVGTKARSGSELSFNDVPSLFVPSAPRYENGESARELSILESLGGGVGVIDFDRDGRSDLLFPGGGAFEESFVTGLENQLYRHVQKKYVDVSEISQIAPSQHYTHGCAVADFNNDGFQDVLVTGYGGVSLWENLGDGTFTNVSAVAAMDGVKWSSSAGWGDVNGDGNLDVYLAQYVDWSLTNNPPCKGPGGKPDVCPPRQFDDLDDMLFLSNGDGTFRNSSEAFGLSEGGKGLGVLLTDVDGDSEIDVYVANDTTNNFLYINQGDESFVEEGVISGTAIDDRANANGSMGIALLDYNNDSVSDIWVTNYEDEVSALYEGATGAIFQHVSSRAGMQSLGQLFVGFGVVACDFDLDGDEDISIANGHVVHFPRNAPTLQKPLILENREGKTFERFQSATNTSLDTPVRGRGLVRLDYNIDGLPDLLFVNSGQSPNIVENSHTGQGNSAYFELVGRSSNRSTIGSRVRLIDKTDEKQMTRWVYGGGSYLSSSVLDVHFGIPSEFHVSDIEITWPSGKISLVETKDLSTRFRSHSRHLIIEPQGFNVSPEVYSITIPSHH